jgi:dihydrolipoamide dehydrogenase
LHAEQGVEWLDSIGVPLARGTGRLTGVREVEVTGPGGERVVLRARQAVVVCTGSMPKLPPVEGLDAVGAWTSRDATSATQVPGRLLVVGGGVVGLEMATAWASLGSHVTVLERGDRLMAPYEPEVGAIVAQALKDRGVEVRTGVEVRSARRRDDGTVILGTAGGEELEGDEVLVGVGRAPRTAELGLEAVGLEPGSYLATDDSMLVQGVEGCGQVIAARAHADADAVDPQPWSRFTATADDAAVPQVVFTDPQVASVGLVEAKARERGLDVRTADYDLASVAGAALRSDDYTG